MSELILFKTNFLVNWTDYIRNFGNDVKQNWISERIGACCLATVRGRCRGGEEGVAAQTQVWGGRGGATTPCISGESRICPEIKTLSPRDVWITENKSFIKIINYLW